MSSMRTGADYRNSLRDGRRVFVLGEGQVDDVTTHPATHAMVDDYVAWYDRHDDPAWKDTLFGPNGAVDYLVPRTSDDLVRMGKCFSATTFLSAGNVTHTPAYGHLIALGILHAVNLHKASPEQAANAEAYRAEIARTGRFLTFAAGAAPDRLSAARGSGRPGRAQDRRPLRGGRRGARQDRHAHQPGLRRGRLYRRGQRRGARRPARDLRRAGQCRGRHGDLPQALGARSEPVHRTAQQPLRRARRPDVARRRGRAVEPRLPHRLLARAHRALAVLAPALLLAVQGRVHLWAWHSPAPTRWDSASTRRRSITCST